MENFSLVYALELSDFRRRSYSFLILRLSKTTVDKIRKRFSNPSQSTSTALAAFPLAAASTFSCIAIYRDGIANCDDGIANIILA